MGGDGIEEYRRLAHHPYIHDALIPGDHLRSLIHSTRNGEPVRFMPNDLIVERDLPDRVISMVPSISKVFSSIANSYCQTISILAEAHRQWRASRPLWFAIGKQSNILEPS
jgi:hypothetical protein